MVINQDVWVVAVVAPTLLVIIQAIVNYFTNKSAARIKAAEKLAEVEATRKDKELQFAREDALTARLREEINEIKEIGEATYLLADSSYSAQLRTNVEALQEQLALLKRIETPSAHDADKIRAIVTKIADLEKEIAEREAVAATTPVK